MVVMTHRQNDEMVSVLTHSQMCSIEVNVSVITYYENDNAVTPENTMACSFIQWRPDDSESD